MLGDLHWEHPSVCGINQDNYSHVHVVAIRMDQEIEEAMKVFLSMPKC